MLLTNKQFTTINTCLRRSVYLPIFGDDVEKFIAHFLLNSLFGKGTLKKLIPLFLLDAELP